MLNKFSKTIQLTTPIPSKINGSPAIGQAASQALKNHIFEIPQAIAPPIQFNPFNQTIEHNMKDNFIRVKKYLFELGYNVVGENETDGLLVIEDESLGIKNLVIGCMDPILIMEQIIFKVNNDNPEIYRELLKKNRDIVHGAFVLDEAGENVIFRDTLQIDNLDLNELEGSLTSLTLLLMEYSNEILEFSKN